MQTSINVMLNLKLLLLNVIVLLVLSEKCDTSVIKSTQFKDMMQLRKYGRATYTRNIYASISQMDKRLEINGTLVCNRYNPMKPDFMSLGHRISETKCLGYIWDQKVWDERNNRETECRNKHPGMSTVRGGKNATKAEFPHMGAVGWKSNKKGHYIFLAGSFLINEYFLITAAHIQNDRNIVETYDLKSADPKLVRLGVENIVVKYDKFRKPTDVKILEIHPHENYKRDSSYDIALIQLKHKVKFNSYIRPICLWDTYTLNHEMNISIAGWGITKDRLWADMSDTLKTVQLKVEYSMDCDKKLKQKRRDLVNHDIQLCFTGDRGDTCNGDSGGVVQEKLQIKTERPIYRAIAVASFGSDKCGTARFPTVYTKIYKSLDWIEAKVWGKKSKQNNTGRKKRPWFDLNSSKISSE